MIIGGHSHTLLDEPTTVNNILISQAGVGTDQIGRYDLVVDDDTNSIVESKWQLIPINETIAKPDEQMLSFIKSYKKQVDTKYDSLLCKFGRQLTHPLREVETSLGNLVADAFAESAGCDVMMVGSGSIRVEKLGPIVKLQDFMACFPYDDSLTRFTVTGAMLKTIFAHVMRKENRDGEGECYQVSTGASATYGDSEKKLLSFTINGEEVVDDKTYTLCLQGYHINNAKTYLNVTPDELLKNGASKVVTTSAQDVLEEFLRNNQNITRTVEGRLKYR
jgi:5'-nucleotidase